MASNASQSAKIAHRKRGNRKKNSLGAGTIKTQKVRREVNLT